MLIWMMIITMRTFGVEGIREHGLGSFGNFSGKVISG